MCIKYSKGCGAGVSCAPIPRQNRGRNSTAAALSPRRQTRYELCSSSDNARKCGRKSMAAKTKFRGSFTALVTPFKNGSLDEAALRDLPVDQRTEGRLVERAIFERRDQGGERPPEFRLGCHGLPPTRARVV